MNTPIEGPSHFQKLSSRRHSVCKNAANIAVRIQGSAGQLNVLAVRVSKKAAKKSSATLRCDCQHAKSIHSRMYANRKLGTSCNFPGCRCKAYSTARD